MIFEKITLHHIEHIQPHAGLWEIADDICPCINALKIFSGLIGVQIVPPLNPPGNGGDLAPSFINLMLK